MYLCDMGYAAVIFILYITHCYSIKYNFFNFCYI